MLSKPTQQANHQTGFAALETVLILIVIAIVAFTGWYVWHAKQNADKTNSASLAASQGSLPATKSKASSSTAQGQGTGSAVSTLASGRVSYKMPAGWEKSAAPNYNAGGCEGNATATVKCLQGVTVAPAKYAGKDDGDFGVTISVFSSSSNGESPKTWFEKDWQGGDPVEPAKDVVSDEPIAGYSAYYYEQNAGDFTDENYVLNSGNTIVYIYARVMSSSPKQDFTAYKPAIAGLVNSVKFN